MLKISDQELIKNALMGYQGGYTAIVNRYKGSVYCLAYRILNNRELAEEASQDVFLKVFRSLGTFRFESKFSSWIYRIVYTTSISYLRKRKDIFEELTEFHSESFMNKEEDFSLNYDKKLRKIHLNKALEEIPAEDSLLLYLYYFMEQSLVEIGQMQNVSEDTLKVRLYRARKKLGVILEKNNYEIK